MNSSPKNLAMQLLDALSTRDRARMDALLADDAVFYDPHYNPPLMVGKPAINAGTDWVFGFLKSMNFTVRRAWEDADSAVLEVDTHHVAANDMVLEPPQVFVAVVKDGKIASWKSYVPYPPPAPPAP